MKFSFFLLVSLLLCSFTGYSQALSYEVTTTNYTTQKKEPATTIKIYEGSNQIFSSATNGSGVLVVTFEKGKTYKIEASKTGKVTRFAYVNTSGIEDELIQGSGGVKGRMQISLFDEQPNVDYSYITQNPFTTFSFDGTEMVFNSEQASKMSSQIEKILKDAEKNAKNKEAEYNAAVKAADAFYAQKKYNEAIAEYEKASMAKPTEKYPAQQITAIETILKAEKAGNEAKAQAEQDYKNLITSADALRDQKKYTEAKAKYLEAYGKKPEPYAKSEADKCDAAIANAAKDAENQKNYEAAMTAGNTFFNQKSWMMAKENYNKALKFIPNDPNATAKLKEIDGKLNALKLEQDKKANHDKLVAEADALFDAADYANAKTKYNDALALMSGSQYEIARIADCNTKIAELEALKAKQVQIDKFLTDGNTAFLAAKYPDAKLKYLEVLKLDAENATAKGRITEIDNKIAEEKANADKIAAAKKLVAEGDALAKTLKYAEAIEKYNQAQATYNDPTVQPKIDAANTALKGAQDAAEKKANFEKAIQEGNELFAAKNYEGARAKYNDAAGIDGTSNIPKQKIAEIEKAIAADKAAADAATKKVNFEKAMQEGNDLLAAKNYDGAIAKYTDAGGIDGASPLPKQKIAEVEKAKNADKVAADAATKKANFEKAMQEADALLASKSYDAAKLKYGDAGAIDGTSPLPKQKIAEIDKMIAAEKAEADAAKKKADYDKLLTEGNALFDSKDYEGAKAKYNAAVTLDGNRNEAKEKLAQITKLASDQAALDKQKKEYEALMLEGNNLKTAGKLTEALAKYTAANKVDGTQAEPVQKIAEINTLLKGEAQKQEITKLLTEGNAALGAKKYTDAKNKYQAVLALDPLNTEAKTKFDEAVKAEIEQSGAEAKLAQFQALKTEGEAFFAQGKYLEAKQKFETAKSIQADAALDKKIADCDAKIAELAKATESTQKFAQAVQEAKALEAATKYDDAISKYEEALTY